jgi:GrpB-like predicted nucleotidyltransferase (UPF0157 family)
MKITLENHSPQWSVIFNNVKEEIYEALKFINPVIEHIGSTSIPNLKAKPIIDILVGIENEHYLNEVINPLTDKNYIYYQKYNSIMPYRRFFAKLKSKPAHLAVPKIYYEGDEVLNELNDYKLAHIHVLQYNSYHWQRHIAFKKYVLQHPHIKNAYEDLKIKLSGFEWKDANEYSAAKNDFIKHIEKEAMQWYRKTSLYNNNN